MRARIVILGANFAGLSAAQALPRDHAVTVVDQGASFEWLPNIHELVSGVKRARDLRLPRRRLIAAAGHHFVRARVETIEPRARHVTLEDGRVLPFDACLVALGGVHDTFGIARAERYALPFKTVEQCEAIGRRLRALARGRAPLSIVIVGGGLEGIEALGEILRRYRTRPGLAITVVETSGRLLPGTPAGLDAVLRADCESLPVRFATGARVTAVRPKSLRVHTGEVFPFDLCIWSAGAKPPALLQQSGLARARHWAPARPTLQSQRFDDVFLAGDAAALPEPLSKQAFFAIQMGEQAARNIDAFVRGQPLLPFTPSPKPMLVTFGDLDTFLVQDGTALVGTGLAAVKEAVFQLTMAQLDPPTSRSALGGLGDRLARGLGSVLPALTSTERLLRLPRVRLV